MAVTKTRGDKKAERNLGYIQLAKGDTPSKKKSKPYRSEHLEEILKYYEDRAYDGKIDWFEAEKMSGDTPIPKRDRKPFIRLNLPKLFSSRLASKLCGSQTFPQIKLEEDPDTQFYLNMIINTGLLSSKLVQGARLLALNGSALVRFYVVGGRFKVEAFNSNYCYPEFDQAGDLEKVVIQYVYKDYEELDKHGKPKKKWYRADLSKEADILYDRPDYDPEVEPKFQVIEEVKHGLGFVQAEWFRTSESSTSPDGISLVDDCIPWLDELNYSLCRSHRAVEYNQDPQLTMKGMDEDEINELVRSNENAWNLGRDGDAGFLESGLNGVESAVQLRDKARVFLQDLTRIVLMDPEKFAGHAQSGKALEILHGPLIELIDELRPQFASHFTNLVVKMAIVNLILAKKGFPAPVSVPPEYEPQTLNFSVQWPPVFPMTTQDLLERVRWVGEAVQRNLVSRRTGVATLAKDFGVEDVDLELQMIETQPQLGGGFGFF